MIIGNVRLWYYIIVVIINTIVISIIVAIAIAMNPVLYELVFAAKKREKSDENGNAIKSHSIKYNVY